MQKKLNEKEKIDVLKYNISRFDHYYASVNFKSSFLVLGNITILGLVSVNEDKLGGYIIFVLYLLIASTLISVLLAIRPYLKSNKIDKSIISFDEIANSTKNEYITKIKLLTQRKYIKDLNEQTYFLAKGLQRKFLYLNIATFSFIFTVLILFILIAFFNVNIGVSKWIKN